MTQSSRTPASLGILLRLAYQHWTQTVDTALADAGFGDIRPLHSSVFAFTPEQGIRVSELTKLAHVRKQSITEAVEELEKLGYVERRPDPDDRRARLVHLTARGRMIRPIAVATGERVERHWAHLIGDAEMATLERSLLKLVQQLQTADGNEAADAATSTAKPGKRGTRHA
ncbi:MarR family winged helix-turn-helix transcriptional regulator [Burkholderia arboris]|uniref:MarR family winged helix-turn-helix transcriptional regulator n=1 Tax=Burkholderia arboris TaxID=488730 RepID=UPI00210AD5EE|nr:MarR family transcriptional regulator [Burkholderia arboris]UTV56004.1 MarR family transcriptional regulator [Burkholderia arboris]